MKLIKLILILTLAMITTSCAHKIVRYESGPMDYVYLQKVEMIGGFYVGCRGTVVAFDPGQQGFGVAYNVDLDGECDHKKVISRAEWMRAR